MYCNPLIVKALMHLRGIDELTLANLVHTTQHDMRAWLYDEGEMPPGTQLEVLHALGIQVEMADSQVVNYRPRGDIVHYWRVYEPFFSRSSRTYWALHVMLKAFGAAKAVFIAPESDPAIKFSAKSCFGLSFTGFYAILEVTAHPMRSISFDPENMGDLSWVPDTIGILLPEAEYAALEPGAMKVPSLQQYLTYNAETVQWARLRDTAMEKGIRAEQVASVLSNLPATTSFEAITHTEIVIEDVLDEELEDVPVAAKATPQPVQQAAPQPTPAPQAVAPATAAAPTTPAPVTPAPLEKDDDMRLFVTPVAQRNEGARVKRVA